MLSYRHSFHAGNHADVLKHTVQSLIIESLKEKDKPFLYLDTHAGAGVISSVVSMRSVPGVPGRDRPYLGTGIGAGRTENVS